MKKNAFFLKKKWETFCGIKKTLYLCIAIEKQHGSIAQLNRAFDYGSKGYRFESYWSHSKQKTAIAVFFCIHMLVPEGIWVFFKNS